MRRRGFFLLLAAACGGSGGGGTPAVQQQPLRIVLQALDAAVAGKPVPMLVSVKRGSAHVTDYEGLVTFHCSDPNARYPSGYEFEAADGGERLFPSQFFLPAGVHLLEAVGEGIDEPALLAVSVEAGLHLPPPALPPTPSPPGPVKYFTRADPPFYVYGSNGIALGDIDVDGDLDLVVSGTASGVLYLNDGSGAFSMSAQQGVSTLPSGLPYFQDVDGDGYPDLALLVQSLAGVWEGRILLNDRNGAFLDSGQNVGAYRSLAFGDLDGDGDADLVLGEFKIKGGFYVRRNEGGRFNTVIQFEAGKDAYTCQPALGDIDGDGDLDLVARAQIWRNDGSGAFVATGQTIPRKELVAPVLADMDGDGDLDLVCGNYDQVNDLYINDGTGAFARSNALQTEPLCTFHLLVLDLDEDGDLDIIELNSTQVSPIWFNEGSIFVRKLPDFENYVMDADAGDVTGDGRPDFFTLGSWPPYTNTIYRYHND